MLRLWLLWRTVRIVVPVLIVLALLANLSRQSPHPASHIQLPAIAPITRVIASDASGLIARARLGLTHALERGAPRR